MPDYALIAAEFALGRPGAVTALAGGGPGVVKLTTAGGDVKPCRDRTSAELYDRVAVVLGAAGIRQALPRRTVTGPAVSSSGHAVQEFLPGQISLRPTAAQTAATMRHVAEYHTALAQVRPPAALRVADSIWKRLASAEYLVRAMPGLLRDPGPPLDAGPPPDAGPPRDPEPPRDPGPWPEPERPRDCGNVIAVALGRLADALPLLRRLPAQLVHGDIGPDNVLMDGDRVVAIIDFTAHEQPFLFALCTAVYWYHVYGHDDLDFGAVAASLAAARAARPWTELEAAAWPAMLIRESLRRLATTLAVARAAGTAADPAAAASRYLAVRSVILAWPELTGLALSRAGRRRAKP